MKQLIEEMYIRYRFRKQVKARIKKLFWYFSELQTNKILIRTNINKKLVVLHDDIKSNDYREVSRWFDWWMCEDQWLIRVYNNLPALEELASVRLKMNRNKEVLNYDKNISIMRAALNESDTTSRESKEYLRPVE